MDSIEKIYSLQVEYPSVFPLTDDDKIWIENKINELSIRNKCAQLIMPAVYRNDFNTYSSGYEGITSLVKNEKIGGLILFQGGMEEQITFINQMQELTDIPLIIASDFERGLGTRIDDALEFPHPMALGSTRNPEYAFEVGRITSLESRQIGVHQNFAPVADINNNSMNPIINIRSFSEDKEEVTKFVKAFIEGAKETRVISTAKHFPGHGNTTIDSHFDLPKINGSRNLLMNNELFPFIEAIKSGVQSIMVGHLEVPSLEPVKGVPSSLSKSIVTYLLKDDLKFDGLIITDAMIMDAITKFYSTEEATVAAFEAGNDIILMPEDEREAINALEKEVNSGRISIERLNESVRKILAAKRWLKIENEKIINLSSTGELKSKNSNLSLARKIAEESITLLKNEKELIPLRLTDYKNIYCITITDKRLSERIQYFSDKLQKRLGGITSYFFTGNTKRKEYDQILKELSDADLIIIPSFIDVKTYKGPVNLSAEQIDFIAGVLRKKMPAILISLKNPYLIYQFPEAETYLNSFSHSYPSQDAMLSAVLGETDINGRLPITIPDSDLAYGSGIHLEKLLFTTINYGLQDNSVTKKIDEQAVKGINQKLFPGSVILAAMDGKIFYHKAFGKNGFGKNNYIIQKNDVFNIGELSNLYTTACALKLIDERSISPDNILENYFDGVTDPKKKNISVKDIILHNSGFGSNLNNVKAYWSKEDFIINLIQEDLAYKSEEDKEQRLINIILLQQIIESASGVKLAKYFETKFREPLNILKSGYSYSRGDNIQIYYDPSPPLDIAPKTKNELLSNILKSETDGTSGFDGFYTNAFELAIFLQMLLQNGYYDQTQILNAETVENFFNGFKENKNSSEKIFELIDPSGFLIRIDYDRNYFIIVLTNAEIKNPANQSFIDFSKKIIQIFDAEINKDIL
jgi:beta-glucosidase-like glycosyl hydrolase/CubicO group peptidase (beta-lactamase class C family)